MTLKEYILTPEGRSVMISQPMRGKTEEQIRAERADLQKILSGRMDIVEDTVFPDFVTAEGKNIPLLYLGESLKHMAKCDVVIFMPGWEHARGCVIEHMAAENYGLEVVEM